MSYAGTASSRPACASINAPKLSPGFVCMGVGERAQMARIDASLAEFLRTLGVRSLKKRLHIRRSASSTSVGPTSCPNPPPIQQMSAEAGRHTCAFTCIGFQRDVSTTIQLLLRRPRAVTTTLWTPLSGSGHLSRLHERAAKPCQQLLQLRSKYNRVRQDGEKMKTLRGNQQGHSASSAAQTSAASTTTISPKEKQDVFHQGKVSIKQSSEIQAI